MIDHVPMDVEPTHHNAKDKYQVLEWSKLPKQPSDMNYRPQLRAVGVHSAITTICVTSAAAVGSPPSFSLGAGGIHHGAFNVDGVGHRGVNGCGQHHLESNLDGCRKGNHIGRSPCSHWVFCWCSSPVAPAPSQRRCSWPSHRF